MAPPASETDIRTIYRDTIDDLYGFVSRRCDGDRDLAEDITQEAWVRAIHVWRRDGVPDKPLAWLATVAARLLSNHRRRAPAVPLDESTTASEPEPDADDRLPLLRRARARLPFTQAPLLRAFHYDRRAITDIAAQTGLSERAVEGRLRRARQQLRRAIETDIANGVGSYE
jgi:RNA polymerase sigma-70 factor (ECF subfamily)